MAKFICGYQIYILSCDSTCERMQLCNLRKISQNAWVFKASKVSRMGGRLRGSVMVWVSVRHPIVDSLQQHLHPSFLWQALWAGVIGSAQEHLHWMTWFIQVCWPNIGKEKAVVNANHGSSSEFRSEIYWRIAHTMEICMHSTASCLAGPVHWILQWSCQLPSTSTCHFDLSRSSHIQSWLGPRNCAVLKACNASVQLGKVPVLGAYIKFIIV